MIGRRIARWALVGWLASQPAWADVAPDIPRPRRAPEASYLTGEDRRESCVNEKATPWLPEVTLPSPDEPGAQALGWRPVEVLRGGSWWLRGAIAGALLVLGCAALRQRAGRGAALAVALAPLVLGLGEAQWQLGRLAEGLALPFSCVPREGVFQRHAQLARDAASAGLLVSLGLLALLAVVVAATRARDAAASPGRSRRRPAIGAALGLGGLLLWAGMLRAEEAGLAAQVSGLVGSLERSPIALPASPHLEPERLPDVPLLLIGADGVLHYDDQRGQRPPTASPLLEPYEGETPSRDELDRPPFFLLAIDGAASWASIKAALDPLSSRGYLGRQWLLFGPVTRAAPGSPPRAPVVVFWSIDPPGREDPAHPTAASRPLLEIVRKRPSVRYGAYPTMLGWLSDRGLALEGPLGPLGEGCAAPGDTESIPRPGLDPASLGRCLDAIKTSPSLELDDFVDLLILPAEATPWSEIAWVLDESARPRPPGDREIVVRLLPRDVVEAKLRASFRESQARRRLESLRLEAVSHPNNGLVLGAQGAAAAPSASRRVVVQPRD